MGWRQRVVDFHSDLYPMWSYRHYKTNERGGDGVNWAIHRAYYIDLLKKGWPLKKAYDEAIRLSVEVTA